MFGTNIYATIEYGGILDIAITPITNNYPYCLDQEKITKYSKINIYSDGDSPYNQLNRNCD